MPQYILIAANKGFGGANYLVSSATQGNRMVPFAYSIAKRFNTIALARAEINDLSQQYKGLSGWKAEKVME